MIPYVKRKDRIVKEVSKLRDEVVSVPVCSVSDATTPVDKLNYTPEVVSEVVSEVEPVEVEPVEVEPVEVEPVKVEPVKVEPVKVDSVSEATNPKLDKLPKIEESSVVSSNKPKPKLLKKGNKKKVSIMPEGYTWIKFRLSQWSKYKLQCEEQEEPIISLRYITKVFGEKWRNMSVEERVRVFEEKDEIDWVKEVYARGIYDEL